MLRQLSLYLCLTLLCFSCKKGEDDPWLSILSRKQRLKGDWTLYQGSGSREFNHPTTNNSFNESYVYDNFTNSVHFTSSTQDIDYQQDMYVYYSFYGKDSVTHTVRRQEFDPQSGSSYEREITQMGTWDWASGDGKARSHIDIRYFYLKDWKDQGGVLDSSIVNYKDINAPTQLIKIRRLSKSEFNISLQIDSSGTGYTDISSWQMDFLKD